MTTDATTVHSEAWRSTLRSLFRLNDGPWRWSVGIQAGLASGIPLATFTIAGQQSGGLIATLGTFTALYCAQHRLVDRFRALPFVAVGFITASAIGTLTSANVWSTVFGLILVAAIACTLTLNVALGPPGPMMYVLVAGVSGHLAAPVSHGGAGNNRLVVPLLVAIGAFSAYLIVIAPLASPSIRRKHTTPSTIREIFPFRWFDNVTRIIVTRVLLSVTIASAFSIPLGVPHVYWVIMTAGVLLQTGHTLRIPTIRALQRVGGTILGVGAFSLLAMTNPSGFWIVVVVAALQFAVEVVIVRNYGLGLMFITPVALTISTAVGTTGVLVVGADRIIDTILGAGIAMIVLYASEWIRTRHVQ